MRGLFVLFGLICAGTPADATLTDAQVKVIESLRDAYIRCVDTAFDFTHSEDFIRDSNLPAAIEHSFADCRTEEEALYTTVASLMILSRPNEVLLQSRAMVDRLKFTIKTRILRDFGQH
jgi:hypothetical protein